jgi:isopentenyl-diphosphate delta-isomerase
LEINEELIVLVDDDNHPIGTAPKLASHHANTPLHRAFSCFVFDRHGRLLLTQRARSKKTFPGVWTNSCCGHPGPNEDTEAAIGRRMKDELGMTIQKLRLALPHFRYRAEMNGIVENEICPVYLALAEDGPRANPNEVEAFEWVGWDVFVERARNQPESLSYWSVKEAEQLRDNPVMKEFISELSL